MERYGNISLDESDVAKGDKALKTLYKQHHVPIVYIFSYWHYFTFAMCLIKVWVKVTQLRLIPSLDWGPCGTLCEGWSLSGSFGIGGWGCKRGLSQEQGLLNHLPQGEHLVFVLGLDSGNGYGNCRCHHTCYRLLKRGVHDSKVSYDLLKMGNCFRELVCVCELRGVIKLRENGCYYSCFSLRDVERRGILWLSSSDAIDKVLEGQVNARSLPIAYVMLELMDGIGKALNFFWKGIRESHNLRRFFFFLWEWKIRRKRKRNFFFICRINGLWFCAFVEYKKNNSATNLSRWQFSKW